MQLDVKRKWRRGEATIGELYLNDVFECYTLEDVVRDVKIPKKTAIWAGVYRVILSLSGRFKRVLPEILDVPQFTAIRMHAGNTDADTEGCILVGRIKDVDIDKDGTAYDIGDSLNTLNVLMAKLEADGGPFTITITNEWEGAA